MTMHTTWTFDGLAFSRETAEDFTPWFASEVAVTEDAVLPDGATSRSYIDLGATTHPPLQLRARFDTSAERETFIGKLRTQALLTNTRGRSATALLEKAARVDAGRRYRFLLDVTFRYVTT